MPCQVDRGFGMEPPSAQPRRGVTLPNPGADLIGLAATAAWLVVYALIEPDFTLKMLTLAAAGVTVAIVIVQAIDRRSPTPKLRWSSAELRRVRVFSAWALLGGTAVAILWIVFSRPDFAAALVVLLFGPFLVLVVFLCTYTVRVKAGVRTVKTR